MTLLEEVESVAWEEGHAWEEGYPPPSSSSSKHVPEQGWMDELYKLNELENTSLCVLDCVLLMEGCCTVDVKLHWRPHALCLWMLPLTKSSVSSKSHQLSQWPTKSIYAPRELLHARNIHVDPDNPASDKSLNQPIKQTDWRGCEVQEAKKVQINWHYLTTHVDREHLQHAINLF